MFTRTHTSLFLAFVLGLGVAFAQSPVASSSPDAIEALQKSLAKEMASLEAIKKERQDQAARSRSLEDPVQMRQKVISLEERLNVLENPTTSRSVPAMQINMNHLMLGLCAVLVFLMQPGFCFLEAGVARAKNAINVNMKGFLDFCGSSICYLLFGFTLMFGASQGGWLGGGKFWLSSLPGDSPVWGMWVFECMFAAAACTIASGAMAERTKFLGYLVYSGVFGGLIYPIFGHWAWGDLGKHVGFGGGKGWLQYLGFHDFAGGTVVHCMGGACALAGIIVVGPRQGKFAPDGQPRMIPGHNVALTVLGGFLLWAGWFGFNAGSGLIANTSLGRVMANSIIGGSAGCLTAMVLFWKLRGTPDISIAINGALGGLVSITPGADVITPFSALIIGGIAGIFATSGTIFMEKVKLDDVANAVPVHLFNGVWGTVALAFFHESGFTVQRIGTQIFGCAALTVGAFISAFLLFKVIDVYIGLRASDEEQEDGLDFTEHAANAYPDFLTAER